jgi:hypothetical protein
MPGNLWSAPAPPSGALTSTVLLGASMVSGTLADISSQPQPVIPAGSLNPGTRVRVKAFGEYTATNAAATFTLGFYMNAVGVAIGTTEAVLAASGSVAAAVATAWPWSMEYTGNIRAISLADVVTGTNASINGQGELHLPTSLTGITVVTIPVTAATRTVTQTATGLVTYLNQYVAVGFTPGGTVADWTSITCDELTCELLG